MAGYLFSGRQREIYGMMASLEVGSWQTAPWDGLYSRNLRNILLTNILGV
jgi:hypothetical protein